MLGSVRGFATASIVALGALAISHGSASAITVPVQQKSANVELVAQNSNIQQVAEHRRRVYWRNRQARFGYVRQGYYPRYWRRPDRYWRYRYSPQYHYWPYHSHFYDQTYWDVHPWYDDPPIIIEPSISYGRSAHVEWCLNRYRSYNPRTNAWVSYRGKVRQCNSPYDRR